MGAVQNSQAQLPLRPAGPETVRALLQWYEAERRDLPWRYGPRKKADPYRVWLSEIMLQQTTVKAVVPYFERFVARWPTVAALAAAPLEEVLQLWAGLGYYSRARNLKACADAVVRDFGGVFPRTEKELLELPGIGPYTAAAITAIAFGEKATPVDGNVERVVSRLFAVRQPLPAAKSEIRRLAATLTPARRAGDFAQAMMDLGAEICTPKNPSCLVCPLQQDCAANARGLAEVLPIKAKKLARPSRYGIAFLVQREDGAVLLRQRPEAGLLGGMLEVPSTPWLDALPAKKEALAIGARHNVLVAGGGNGRACVHALPSRAERLSRAGAGRCELHAMGRAGALPLGRPARPPRPSAAEPDEESHRARAGRQPMTPHQTRHLRLRGGHPGPQCKKVQLTLDGRVKPGHGVESFIPRLRVRSAG